jgi:hypothetical protein
MSELESAKRELCAVYQAAISQFFGQPFADKQTITRKSLGRQV